MPPKKAAAATKKAPAKVTKTAAAATKKAPAAKKAAAAAKPASSASRSRKTKDEYDVDEIGDEPEPPKTKKTTAATAKKTNGAKAPAAAKKAAPAKKPAAKKAAPAKKAAAPAPAVDDDKENANPAAPKANGKRKRDETEDAEDTEDDSSEVEERPAPPAKKAKTVAPKKIAVPKIKFPKVGPKINSAPTAPLQVFVMGEGSSGELGMGSKRLDGKMPIDVKRPRINPLLSSEDVGVVQIACGGMHVVALTKNNKILTWGVNDQGALGRDTTWDGGLRDADAEEESGDEDDDTGVNPKESTPTEVNTTNIAPDAKFVQVVAGDSASFALTEDGRVYGWGTFRGAEGVIGFSSSVETQRFPVLMPEPKKIVQLAAGSNHVLALDHKGKVYTWGCSEQGQLGRRCIERNLKESALRPDVIGFKRGTKLVKVACGAYHSFALDNKGQLFAWGLNNHGNLGIRDNAGVDNACIPEATRVEALEPYKIAEITGGEHHSLACTEAGELLAWGRCDGSQTGIPKSKLSEDVAAYDDRGKPRDLMTPLVVDGISDVIRVAAGTDSNLALTSAGKAYSWGFSINYQTGQGTTEEIETPTLVDNTAVRDKKLVYVGCGGQFSILACEATPAVNGVAGTNH